MVTLCVCVCVCECVSVCVCVCVCVKDTVNRERTLCEGHYVRDIHPLISY